MKQLALCFLPFLVACVADSSDISDTSDIDSTAKDVAPLVQRPLCSTSSFGVCSGAAQGFVCHIGPLLRCLPAQDLPDGGVFCLCQAQSSI
jgi:hypothetical protein